MANVYLFPNSYYYELGNRGKAVLLTEKMLTWPIYNTYHNGWSSATEKAQNDKNALNYIKALKKLGGFYFDVELYLEIDIKSHCFHFNSTKKLVKIWFRDEVIISFRRRSVFESDKLLHKNLYDWPKKDDLSVDEWKKFFIKKIYEELKKNIKELNIAKEKTELISKAMNYL